MKLSIWKERCGKWIGGAFLLLLCLTAFSTAAWAETITINVDYPVAGEYLPSVSSPSGKIFQDSRHGWFISGEKCTSENDIELSSELSLCFSINWYGIRSQAQIDSLDYEVVLSSTDYPDIQSRRYTVKASDESTKVGTNTVEFTISGIKPIVLLGEENSKYKRQFTFKWPDDLKSDLKYKEGDSPNSNIQLAFEDKEIWDTLQARYYRAGTTSQVTSSMTGGEYYDLVLTVVLGTRGAIDWENPPGSYLNVPNGEYYERELDKANRRVVFTVKDIPCVRTIDEMEVKELTAPKAGDKPVTTGITLSTADSNTNKPVTITAKNFAWSGTLDNGNFKSGQHYTLSMDYEIDFDGAVYEFDGFSKTNVKVNAGTVASVEKTYDFGGTLTIDFDTPAEDTGAGESAGTDKPTGTDTPTGTDQPAQSALGAGTVSPETPAALAGVEEAVLAVTKDTKDLTGSTFSLLQAKGTAASNTVVKLTWKKVKGATGYVIYGNRCGKKYKFQKLATVTGKSYKAKKLKKGTYYKYLIAAVNGDQVVAVSRTIHVATKGGKVGNIAGVKLSKTKLSLKAGKSKTIKATLQKGKLKVKNHRKLAWESDNVGVATVSSKGKIKAVAKGSCYVYAYTQSGVCAKIKVTVK